MEQTAFRISPYVPEDQSTLLRFYETAWTPPPFKKNPSWLEWSIKGNPYNRPDQTPLLVAWHEDEIIGQFLLIPTELWIDGQPHAAAWGRDLFVAPAFRRNKLAVIFLEKTRELYKTLMASGYSKVFNRVQKKSVWIECRSIDNNEMLLPSMRYLQLTLLQEPSKLLKRMVAMAYGMLQSRRWKIDNSEVSISGTFEPSDNSIWESNKSKYHYISSRSFDFLSWRINNHPYYLYKIFKLYKNLTLAGYLIARENKDTIIIVDIFVNYGEQNIIDNLLSCLLEYSMEKKFVRIILRSACIFIESRAKRLGFVRTTLNQHLRIFSDEFKDNGNAHWYVTSLDSDQDR